MTIKSRPNKSTQGKRKSHERDEKRRLHESNKPSDSDSPMKHQKESQINSDFNSAESKSPILLSGNGKKKESIDRTTSINVLHRESSAGKPVITSDDTPAKRQKIEPKLPQYRKADYAISIVYKQDPNMRIDWSDPSALANRPISHVSIPESRPEGTSGEKEGGHLTPWVAIRSEIHQAVREDMDLDRAIAEVKKLIDNYELMPGHSRGQYLDAELKERYEETKKRVLGLKSTENVTPAARDIFLRELIDAYLRARNALPLAAVATTDNKGLGESTVNDLLWQYERGGADLSSEQLAGLLWCLLDVRAADEWAVANGKDDGNWQAMSPKREEEDEDKNDPNTWESYDRRMVEVFAQHVMGIRMAYPKAYEASKMATAKGIERLFRWLDKPAQLKEDSGIRSVKGGYWDSILPFGWEAGKIAEKLATVLQKAENGEYKPAAQ